MLKIMSDKSHLNLTFTFENNGKNLKKKCFEKKGPGKVHLCASIINREGQIRKLQYQILTTNQSQFNRNVKLFHTCLFLRFSVNFDSMKFNALCLFIVMCGTVYSQDNRQIITEQFTRLNGNWDGFMEYTDQYDNKSKYRMPAQCQTTFNGKKWEYAVQYDEGQGEKAGGKGDCTVNDDGTKMNYDGVVWNVTQVVQSGDSTSIVLETTGKENRKKANLRRTIFVTSETFSITEEVNFAEEGTDFIVRNKHFFRRIK